MKKFISIFFSTLVLGLTVNAQEIVTKKKEKVSFVSQLNAGFLGGDQTTPCWHIENGVSFANHFYAMAGLGYERYNYNPYLPLFLDFKYTILNRKTTPFVSLSSGYLLPMSDGNYGERLKGGYTGGAKIGVSHFFSQHVGIETSVGYRFSQIERFDQWIFAYSLGQTYLPVTTIYNMNRFELSIGLIFK